MSLPVVKRDEKGIPTLYVHDKPFFMRSGEIHNSNASDPAYLEDLMPWSENLPDICRKDS